MTAVRSDTDISASDGGGQPGETKDAPVRKHWIYRLVPLAWVAVIVGLFFALGGAKLVDFGDDGLESIENYPDEAVGVPGPKFTKFEADPTGPNSWNVRLTLADPASADPLPPVAVTVTGTAPDGTAYGPVSFSDLGNGVFAGRVTGAPGEWNLIGKALASSDAQVAPTQQSFTVTLPTKAEADAKAAEAKAAEAKAKAKSDS